MRKDQETVSLETVKTKLTFDEALDVVDDGIDRIVFDAGRPRSFVVPSQVGSDTPEQKEIKSV